MNLSARACAELGEETIRLFTEHGRESIVPKGEVCWASSIGDYAAILDSGVIAVLVSVASGRTSGLFLAEPGFVVNVMRIAGDTQRYASDFNDAHFGYALTDARLLLVPLSLIREEVRSNCALSFEILAQLTERYKDTLTNMATMVEMSGAQRIQWLFDRVQEVGLDPLDLTHEVIGRFLGMNRVSVTRLMGQVLRSNCPMKDERA